MALVLRATRDRQAMERSPAQPQCPQGPGRRIRWLCGPWPTNRGLSQGRPAPGWKVLPVEGRREPWRKRF
jgi:hypothetical protein